MVRRCRASSRARDVERCDCVPPRGLRRRAPQLPARPPPRRRERRRPDGRSARPVVGAVSLREDLDAGRARDRPRDAVASGCRRRRPGARPLLRRGRLDGHGVRGRDASGPRRGGGALRGRPRRARPVDGREPALLPRGNARQLPGLRTRRGNGRSSTGERRESRGSRSSHGAIWRSRSSAWARTGPSGTSRRFSAASS